MTYDYTPARSDTFAFLIFTFVGAVIGLTITKGDKLRKSPQYKHFASAFLALVAFLFPAAIYLHLWRWEHTADHSYWSSCRNLLAIEAYANFGFFIVILVLEVLKFRIGPKKIREAGVSELHWYINEDTYLSAREHHPFRRDLKKPFDGYRLTNPRLWRLNMTYFLFRFLLPYIVFIPFSIGCNIYVAINLCTLELIPPATQFDDIVFYIVFGLVLLGVTIWLKVNICCWQAWAHLVLIANSFLICYFISDTATLTSLQLGALAIYLSTSYDLILDGEVEKVYNVPCWWIHQARYWRRHKETGPTEDCWLNKMEKEHLRKVKKKYQTLFKMADLDGELRTKMELWISQGNLMVELSGRVCEFIELYLDQYMPVEAPPVVPTVVVGRP